MKLYKLTDSQDRTFGGCQWGEGVTHTAPGTGALCSAGWIHAYTHPLLAVLLNPIHGDFAPPTMHLWECEGDVGATDHGLKVGCTSLTTLHRIDVPVVTTAQRMRFAILCAMEVSADDAWLKWARGWLDGTDRSSAAAARAAEAAEAAAWAAEVKAIDLIAIAERAIREETS